MDKNAFGAVVSKIDGYRDEVIRLQTELSRRQALDPSSGGAGEEAKAKFLQAYLEKMGLAVERFDAPDERVPGGAEELGVVLVGHEDEQVCRSHRAMPLLACLIFCYSIAE